MIGWFTAYFFGKDDVYPLMCSSKTQLI